MPGGATVAGPMATPHELRTLELEALRGLIADCEPHVNSATVANSTVAEIFERHTSRLPESSQLRGQLRSLASKLRRDPNGVVLGSRLRQIVVRLKRKDDVLGRAIDARDAKLDQRL